MPVYIVFYSIYVFGFLTLFLFNTGRKSFQERFMYYYGILYYDINNKKRYVRKGWTIFSKVVEMRKIFLNSLLINIGLLKERELLVNEDDFFFRLKKTNTPLTYTKPYYSSKRIIYFQLSLNYVFYGFYVIELLTIITAPLFLFLNNSGPLS